MTERKKSIVTTSNALLTILKAQLQILLLLAYRPRSQKPTIGLTPTTKQPSFSFRIFCIRIGFYYIGSWQENEAFDSIFSYCNERLFLGISVVSLAFLKCEHGFSLQRPISITCRKYCLLFFLSKTQPKQNGEVQL